MINQKDIENILNERHTKPIQDKISNSTVGIAGLGGLGSNIANSLARLGVGKLVICDFDTVDLSNLNRQQYFINQIDMPKVDALEENILKINPYIKIEKHNTKLNKENVYSIFKNCDIVAEAFDNPYCKAEIINELMKHNEIKVVAGNGMAGYLSSNDIKTKKVTNNLYLCGDNTSDIKDYNGLMAPRVAISANHQANMILRLILGKYEV